MQASQIDAILTHAVNSLSGRLGAVDLTMTWVSSFGIPLLVVAVAAQWWARNERSRTRHVLVAAGLSFLIGLAINQAILLFVHRVRPYDAGISELLIGPSADPSFPSDHATAAFAIAATFFAHRMFRRGYWFLLCAVLVSFSRVYLGTHYLGDVAGGALTGIVAALIARTVYREGTRLDNAITRIF